MSKKISVNLKSIKPQLKKHSQRVLKHAPFIAVLVVLIVYTYTVVRISSLTTAEPSAEDESVALASTNIPKVDKKAVEQIQSLEKSSVEIQSLFNEARNNPFLE